MTPERLRIFISSPGDVAEERVLANNLVRRLSDEFAHRLRIEPVFWEHEPLLATETFQKQIPPPRECEVAICILWSRIGTRLGADIVRKKDSQFGPAGSHYASGTEYEFEDAVSGFEANGVPSLLVYRKTATPFVDLSDRSALLRRLEQKEALDQFVQKWFFNEKDGTLKAAFHSFQTTAEFEQIIEEHLRKLIARRLETMPAPLADATPAQLSWTRGSPFRGLEAFNFEHATVYFGRTQAIGDLLNALRKNAAEGKAFVLVLGVSGGGKSSLVRAGVLPMLAQPGVIEGVGFWRRAIFKPSDGGGRLMQALALALLADEALPELGADGTTPAQLAELLRQNPAAAFPLIKGGLSQAAATLAAKEKLSQQPEGRLVLVVDQLEELFTLANLTPEERQSFIALLSMLARSGKVFVIATLRGDFYHRCFDLPELGALKEGAGQYDLPLPSGTEISQMIREPARAAGLSFEVDPRSKAPLDDVLREAASRSPESLPLLEFALEELYKRKTAAGLLTYAAYHELGGVEGALAKRAETEFASLNPAVQATLTRVMRSLVSVTDGEPVTRQQASLDSVASTPDAKTFVEAFVRARLFTADRTESGDAVVRVTHEALLRNWPRVKSWLEQDRDLLIVRGRVTSAAARWEKEGRPSDLLLGEGKPLAEAQSLSETLGTELPEAVRSFITFSRARQRRRTQIKRAGIAALVVLAIAIGAASILAARAKSQAASNQRLAESANALAARRLQGVGQLTLLLDGIDKSLNDLPGSTPARSHLAEITLQCLNGFEADEHSDPVFLFALGSANRKVASLLGSPYSANGGQVRQALEAYRKSISILERLPDNGPAQRLLAGCHVDIGGVQEEIGDQKGSLESCRKGLDIYGNLAAAKPADRVASRKMLRAYIGVGDAQANMGRFDDAMGSFQRALELGEKFLGAGAAVQAVNRADDQRDLLLDFSTCIERLGVVQTNLGHAAQALESHKRTLKIRQDVLEKYGSTPYIQLSLLVSYRKIGEVCLAANDLPEAERNYKQSMALAKTLFDVDPSNSRWERNLWETYKGLADTQLRMGNSQAALTYYQQALELAQGTPPHAEATFTQTQRSVSYQGIGESLSQLGRVQESLDNCQKGLAFAQNWANVDPDHAQAHMNLALAHVRTAHALVGLAHRDGAHAADQAKTLAQALEEFDTAASIVQKAKDSHTFDAKWTIWFSTLPAEIDAVKGKTPSPPASTTSPTLRDGP